MANPGLFLFIFVHFIYKFYRKNCKCQRDSNSDRRSRRRSHWHTDHFDHHHGPIIGKLNGPLVWMNNYSMKCLAANCLIVTKLELQSDRWRRKGWCETLFTEEMTSLEKILRASTYFWSFQIKQFHKNDPSRIRCQDANSRPLGLQLTSLSIPGFPWSASQRETIQWGRSVNQQQVRLEGAEAPDRPVGQVRVQIK